MVEHLVMEGTVSFSPRSPALCDSVILLLWSYRSRGDASSGGEEALHAATPKVR